MAHQYHSHVEYQSIKVPRNLNGSQDIRVLLAEYILNFEFPRDIYSLLITGLVIYLTLKLFRFSIRLLFSLMRPIFFIIMIMIALPYIYEMKSGIGSNRVVSNVYSQTEGIFHSIYGTINTIYTHTIRFYAKNF